ncbi:MAG: CRISPR system precrRNA processing endoribonuclease RAMP protein Cas6 [Actinobacteria bacterium]|nr:CRISPR system precrRNA processing endoribonuclease RAMP protein Cas6 [Actinomycetota bacterium]
MPSRWVVPLDRVDVSRVELVHLHAAISGWLDGAAVAHDADLKPYSISPVRRLGRGCAVEVGLLDAESEWYFRVHAVPGTELRFGRQFTTVTAPPVLLLDRGWEELANFTTDRAWTVHFETPASFRQGERTSPWPAPESLLRGLGQRWARWSGLGARDLSPQVTRAIWVSDLDGASDVVVLGRGDRRVHYSGFVGRVRYQCDDADAAAEVGPLFALADFAGVGAATTKGLGVTRLEPTWQPASQRSTGT